MTASYNLFLVSLSILIAVVSAYTAIGLVHRVFHTTGVASKFWFVTGALALGAGIWTMHFVGMLAVRIDMPMTFEAGKTGASLIISVIGSGIAIFVGSRANIDKMQIALSGILLGLCIVLMHYTGMAAVEMPATITYNAWLVAVSVVIAIVAATAAIWIAFTLTHTADYSRLKLKVIASVIMGFAICGMHYTGMTAVSYAPVTDIVLQSDTAVQSGWLAFFFAMGVLTILGFTHLSINFDLRLEMERRNGERAEQEALQLAEILDDSSNEIYLFDTETLRYVKANRGALQNLGYEHEQLENMTPVDVLAEFSEESFRDKLRPLQEHTKEQLVLDTIHKRTDGTTYPVTVHLQLSRISQDSLFVAIVTDISERKNLELQIMQAKKLESIGQLAAGIAHEINTPAQFAGDNTRFLKDAFGDLIALLEEYEKLGKAIKEDQNPEAQLETLEKASAAADIDYLKEEIPVAIDQSIDGITRISKIVRAMKEFSHPGGNKKELVDVNKIIENTIIVASNEWKYVAELTSQLDAEIPPVPCHPQEISQVILNLIVNASHAIAEKAGDAGSVSGKISISTSQSSDSVLITIEDSGNGIPQDIRDRVFDPFFTTKEVGKGTGQGLSMAFTTVVEQHNGQLDFESVEKQGTKFLIQLPLSANEDSNQRLAA